MRLFRAATILALLFSPLYAGYVVKWTAPLGYGVVHFVGKPAISDVDGDSIPDVFLYDSDSTSWRIYSGVSHSLVWTVPSPFGTHPPVVANTDDDSHNELVVLPGMIDSQPFLIYDCATHALEFTSPKGGSVSFDSDDPVADLDGDGRAEIPFIRFPYDVLEVWGWASGSVNENPPSSPPTGLAKASPTPARRSVNFTLPASAGPGSITITDAAGRIVRTLPAPAVPGPRKVQWDCLDNSGRPVPAGAYLYRLGRTSGKLEVVK